MILLVFNCETLKTVNMCFNIIGYYATLNHRVVSIINIIKPWYYLYKQNCKASLDKYAVLHNHR